MDLHLYFDYPTNYTYAGVLQIAPNANDWNKTPSLIIGSFYKEKDDNGDFLRVMLNNKTSNTVTFSKLKSELLFIKTSLM